MNLATRVVGLVITGVALYVVFPSLSRVIGAWPELSTLGPGWLAGAVAAEVVAFTCNFGLQRLVLRTSGWFAVVAAGLVGNAVTAVLPGGDAAGAGVQFRMLARAGINADTAAGGLTVASLLGVGGLLALPIFALPAIVGGAAVRPGLVHAALLGLAGFVLYVVGGIVVLATDQPLAIVGRALQWLWNKSWGRHKKIAGLDRRLLSQRDQIRSVLGTNWRSGRASRRRSPRVRLSLPSVRAPRHWQRPQSLAGAAGLRRGPNHRTLPDHARGPRHR